MPEWKRHLAALLSGPYDGWGGIARLARDLGLRQAYTVSTWADGKHRPKAYNRAKLERLAAEYALQAQRGGIQCTRSRLKDNPS